MFHIIEDAYAILRNKQGVYRQAKIYRRDGYLYAGYSGGFIRLHRLGTSNPYIFWDTIELPFKVTYDKHERMTDIPNEAKFKMIEHAA
jgi:hypothetical protein